ncbi:MAG: hypothetical protein WCI01_03015 [Chlorobiaceae bacterium]
MPITNPKRGVSHIKTLHTVTKASVKKNDTADFLELYMLEKEKQRLMVEESKILTRLDYVQNRLRIIKNIYEHSSHLLHQQNKDYYGEVNSSPGFTTIQIEY